MRRELGRSLPLLALFALGIGAGIWVFASPWVLGYAAGGGWTSSTWSSVWAGAIITAASAVSLIVVLARSVHLALQPVSDRR